MIARAQNPGTSSSHASSSAAKDVDIRGFEYPLQTVLQRQEWKVDRALAELARARQQLTHADLELQARHEAYDAQARATLNMTRQHLDPASHLRAIGYLAHLQALREHAQSERDARHAAWQAQRQHCASERLRLDGLQHHREEALAEYADEMRKRQANESDRDWLARVSVKHSALKEVRG